MKRLGFIVMGIIGFASMHAQSLDVHKWEDRILMIYMTNLEMDIYKRQLEEFKGKEAGMKARKLVVYLLFDGKFKKIDYHKNKQDTLWRNTGDNGFRIGDRRKVFEIVLIGLDGDVKLTQDKLLPREELFRIIDSMPMRRWEIKE